LTIMRRPVRSEFVRKQLPYGCWRCSDGREILFAREYTAICQRSPGQPPALADPTDRSAKLSRCPQCRWSQFLLNPHDAR
jgi:hypothetical protein